MSDGGGHSGNGGDERDDLGSVLRGLAAEGETPPPLTGAQIRRRGEARGLRRRLAGSAAAGVVLIAGAAVGVPPLLKDGEVRQPPAAPPSPTAPVTPGPTDPAETSRQSYVLDLDEGLLTVARDGRPTRTIKAAVRGGTQVKQLTVVSKSPRHKLALEGIGFEDAYELQVRWAVKLTADTGGTTYLYESLSMSPASGAIGIPAPDAEWLYGQLRAGDVITLRQAGD